jgi:hypothetical protein
MNARKETAELETALQSLPGLGYFNDDIRAQLEETAKSIAQDVVDLLSTQYREARQSKGGLNTLPDALWKPLRGKAYILTAEHYESLAKELRDASNEPNMKF